MSDSPESAVGASLRRMRENGVTPNRELGQNFLIDANLLDVVANAADVCSSDTVLEVGGGLGILSEHLAERSGYLHVVEVDRRLEAPLAEAVAPFDNVSLHFGDVLELDLSELDPPPNKLVANLPYGIAAPLLLSSIEQLPECQVWVSMVQREVGERLAAAPGSRTYGVPSAIAQSSCDVEIVRRVSRNVFRPVPHVDSVIVRLKRNGPAPPREVRDLIHAAFAHRRKALARSLALAPNPAEGVRDRARAALATMGLPEDSRAERLSAADFARLTELLAASKPGVSG